MKWMRRLLLVVVFLVVFAGVVLFAGWRMLRGTPDWYGRKKADPQAQAAAAERADKQIQTALSWAQTAQRNQAHPAAAGPASAPPPADHLLVSFSEDELNAFFGKWDKQFGVTDKYKNYLSDPQVVIHNNHLILAGTVTELGTVVSLHFAPRLENGALHLELARVLGGNLPLPRSFWDKYRGKMEAALTSHLKDVQEKAKINPDGTANSDLVSAAMGELLVHTLRNEPAEPVLFLPYDVQNSHKSMPVKLTDVSLADQTLKLTVESMTPAERDALVERVKAAGNATGASAAGE